VYLEDAVGLADLRDLTERIPELSDLMNSPRNVLRALALLGWYCRW